MNEEDLEEDDGEHISNKGQLCHQDYPEDDYDPEAEEEEKYTNENAIALYGENYGPCKTDK